MASNTEIRDEAVSLLRQAIDVLAGITDAAPNPVPPDPEPPAEGRIYHGAYIDGKTMAQYYGNDYLYTVPWDPDEIVQKKFEEDAGKTIAISHWGSGSASVPIWDSDAAGHLKMFQEARRRSCYPLLDTSTASVFLGDIPKGSFDDKIAAWFTKVAEFGKPWLLRLNTEMNGAWYGYGSNDAQGPNQPQNFIASWKHIWEIADSVGANENCTWHWAPNSLPAWDPDYFPHPYEAYYPGDKYVDIAGFVCYNQGKEYSDGDWAYISGPSYAECAKVAVGKPMLISEWSSYFEFTQPPKDPARGTANNKGEFLRNALDWIPENQPAIMGMVMFNCGYDTGKMERNEIETSDTAQQGYQRGISDNPIYLGRHDLADSGKVPSMR
jgi:hypothetical protein